MAIKHRKFIIGVIAIFVIVALMVIISRFNNDREMDSILWAIVSNEPNYLSEELEKGANVDEMSDYEMTSSGNMENNPLRIAADNRSDDCFEVLLSYGANVDYIDKENESLLMYTAASCDYSKFQLLLDYNADISYKNNDKDIMTYAVTAPHSGYGYDEDDAIKIINALSNEGLVVKADDLMTLLEQGYTPAISAMKTIQKLHNDYLNNNFIIKGMDNCIINHICTNNTNEIIDYFNKNTPGFRLIGLCVANDNIDVLKYYYSQGGDLCIINTGGADENLLMVAAAFDSIKCINFLLENGLECNIKNEVNLTAIDYAKKYDNIKSIQLLERN